MGEGAAVKDTGPSQFPLALLGGNMTAGMKKVVALHWTTTQLWKLGLAQYKAARARIAYTVTVDGQDTLYPDIHAWLLALLPPERQRSLIVQSSDRSNGMSIASPDSPEEPTMVPLRFLFDGEREQDVLLEGHKVKVAVSVERGYEHRREYKITFTAFGVPARDAVIRVVEQVAAQRANTATRKPRLYLASRWGDWTRRDDLAARPADSVVLAKGIMETLVDDLATFRSHEADYVRMSVPYHRGYLFHGPPGTGKSSVARALASHFGLDLYYLPLGDQESDANLTQMVSRIPSGAVLLLEDIDAFTIARDRTEAGDHSTGGTVEPGASLSGLLQALDGVATPHGLIVMMTTNRRADLDDALVRDFRVNVDQKIDYLDEEQLNRLVAKFHPDPAVMRLHADARVTPAQVLNIITRRLDDPVMALIEIDALCSNYTDVA